MIPETILRTVDNTIQREGGYVNNPHDRGGPTKFGITERTARRHGYKGDMRDLTRPQAVDIYLKEYMIAPGFDRIADINPAIAEELFDAGVMSGPSVPRPWLQRSLNLLNHSHRDKPWFDDLVVDGILGQKTRDALAEVLRRRGKDGEKVLLRMLNSLQGAFLIQITEGRVQNEEFIYGWFLHRVVI